MTDVTAVENATDISAADPDELTLVPGRRKPNTPLIPEGGDADEPEDQAAEVSGDDIVEQVGEAIFEDTNNRLENPDSREEFGSEIDGLEHDERTNGEQTAIDNTLAELETEETFDIEVIAVDSGTVETIETESGETADVYLGEDEGSRLIEVARDEVVLLLADDLSVSEAVEEVVEANAMLIIDVAESNGVVVDRAGLSNALYFRSQTVVQTLSRLYYFEGLQTSFVETVINDIAKRIGHTRDR